MTVTGKTSTPPRTLEAQASRTLAFRKRRFEAVTDVLDSIGRQTVDEFKALTRQMDELCVAFSKRWAGRTIKTGVYLRLLDDATTRVDPAKHDAPVSTADARASMTALETWLAGASMRWTATGRNEAFTHEKASVARSLGQADAARLRLGRALAAEIAAVGGSFARRSPSLRTQTKEFMATWNLPPGVSDHVAPDSLPSRPAIGRLVVQFGWIVDGSPVLTVGAPDDTYMGVPRTTATDVDPVFSPALLDLDAEGGIVTDDEESVKSLLVRLLGILPAGKLRLHIFDRQRFGRAVDYLLDFDDDKSKKVLTGGVRTSTSALKKMLDELENHLGYITQKYLGGQHASLLDYNRSAGDLAEPYRVLVLFGYPDGFERDGGGSDTVLAAQLDRIAAAGRRCGVFVIVVADPARLATPSRTTSYDSPPTAPTALPAVFTGHHLNDAWPHWMKHLAEPVGSRLMAPMGQGARLATVARDGASALYGLEPSVSWVPAQVPSTSAVSATTAKIKKGLQHETDAIVTAASVSKAAAGLIGGGVDPMDESTWWKQSSATQVVSHVGRRGVRDVQIIQLDSEEPHSHLLSGGIPGSGKSILLNSFISDLARRYSPTELELYLIDLKFGVGFQGFRTLPHARIVGLSTGGEYGVSVLRHLVTEMARRSKLFSSFGIDKLADYRKSAGLALTRIVLVVDEFMVWFDEDDEWGREASRLLKTLLNQGRSFGIHLVLATQTTDGGMNVPKAALGMIPMRVALKSDEATSRLILSESNNAASGIDRKGGAIYNGSHGNPGANTPFQVTFTTVPDTKTLSDSLSARAKRAKLAFLPRVFDARVTPAPPPELAKAIRQPSGDHSVAVPLGLPFDVTGFVVARLRRSGGEHLLVVAAEDVANRMAELALCCAVPLRVSMALIDFGGLASPLTTAVEPIVNRSPAISSPTGRERAEFVLHLAKLVEDRQTRKAFSEPTSVTIVAGLDNANDLVAGSPLVEAFERILDEGPAVGVHLIVIATTLRVFEKRFGSYSLEHVNHRVVGTLASDASIRLIDSAAATTLPAGKLIRFNNSSGDTKSVLGFARPGPDFWRP